MPTPTKGPRLGGGPAHERLLLANLATQLFAHRRITTTEAKTSTSESSPSDRVAEGQKTLIRAREH